MLFLEAQPALLVLSYSLISTAGTDFILHQAPQMTLSTHHKYLLDNMETFQRKIPLNLKVWLQFIQDSRKPHTPLHSRACLKIPG